MQNHVNSLISGQKLLAESDYKIDAVVAIRVFQSHPLHVKVTGSNTERRDVKGRTSVGTFSGVEWNSVTNTPVGKSRIYLMGFNYLPGATIDVSKGGASRTLDTGPNRPTALQVKVSGL